MDKCVGVMVGCEERMYLEDTNTSKRKEYDALMGLNWDVPMSPLTELKEEDG